MLILPSNPSGFSIFCDDIRHELSGKRSLIGVYDDTMLLVSAAPAVIPQFCFLTTIRFDDEKHPNKVTLKIIFEDENFVEQDIAVIEDDFPTQVAQDGGDFLFSDKDGVRSLQLKGEGRIANLALPSNGRIKVRLYVGGEVFALGSLRVIFQPQDGITAPEVAPGT